MLFVFVVIFFELLVFSLCLFLSLSVFRPLLAILSYVQARCNNKQTVQKKLSNSVVIRACMGSIVSIVSIVSNEDMIDC